MNTPAPPRAVALALLPLAGLLLAVGCDDEPELEDDPPLQVPGVEVPEPPAPPPGMPAGAMAMPNEEPQEFDPPLAVPGYETLPDPPAPPMPPPGQAGMQPVGTPIPLAPGFTPDPVVQQGMAGGPVQAATTVPPAAQSQCPGYIGPQPNHVLQLTGAFRNFRIVVSSQRDTTLLVRLPDGSVRCHDDVNYPDNPNPLIEGELGPGTYQVYVGTFDQGQPAPYVIGFTELPQVSAQTLAQQAPPQGAPGQPPPGGAPPGAMAPQAPAR